MVFGSREMVSGHRSMVLPGSDMPSALGLVLIEAASQHATLPSSDCPPLQQPAVLTLQKQFLCPCGKAG